MQWESSDYQHTSMMDVAVGETRFSLLNYANLNQVTLFFKEIKTYEKVTDLSEQIELLNTIKLCASYCIMCKFSQI